MTIMMKTSLAACCLLAACQVDASNIGSTNEPPTGTSPPLSPPAAFGTPRWAVAIDSGVPEGDVGEVTAQVAVDSIGDVVAAGHIGVVDDTTYAWSYSGFISKRAASDGSERWRIAIPGNVSVNGVAIGPDDSIVVVGGYAGTADFGGTTLQIAEPTPPDHTDTFIAKYTWDGQLVWAHGLSQTAYTDGVRVRVDSAGRIVTTGFFASSMLVLDGTTYDRTGNGLPSPYIASFDQDGTLQWGHVLAGDAGVNVADLAVAPNNDIVVVGSFAGSASFGGAIHHTDSPIQGFVTRFRDDGLFLSSGVVGDPYPAESYASGVAIAANGDLAIQGWEYTDILDVNAKVYGAVFTLAPDDKELWRATQVMYPDDQLRTIAATPDGHVVSATWQDVHDWTAGSLEVSRYDLAGGGATTSVGSRSSPAPSNLPWVGASTITTTGALVMDGTLYGTIDFGFGPIGRADITRDNLGYANSGMFIVVVDPL